MCTKITQEQKANTPFGSIKKEVISTCDPNEAKRVICNNNVNTNSSCIKTTKKKLISVNLKRKIDHKTCSPPPQTSFYPLQVQIIKGNSFLENDDGPANLSNELMVI